MGIVQWLLLILAIVGVVSIYVVTKRREGPNPWRDMQNPDLEDGQLQDFQPVSPAKEEEGGDQFSGMLGADDIPDLPVEGGEGEEGIADDDLPAFEVHKDFDEEAGQEAPQGDLNPAGLKRSSGPVLTDESEQRIVVLHVAAREGGYFEGEDIHAALRECKLQFGMHDVYHRITEVNGIPESVFSVANMLKPGFLNPDEAAELRTPGLVMFMVLPGPMDGVRAARDMIETANHLADALDGEVLDDKRALLKRQTAQFLLDEIAEDERKQRIKARHG